MTWTDEGDVGSGFFKPYLALIIPYFTEKQLVAGLASLEAAAQRAPARADSRP